MAAPVLAYENLGLVQGSGWLFRNLDLFIGERDRLALIGRNGAGKTTLLKCLADLIETDEGRRTIQPGIKVVLLEQDPPVTDFATLRDFALAAPDAPAAHEVEAVASQIGVDLDRPSMTASGGERRRAAIARAIAQNPDVLLLDEPTNHLDLAGIEWLEEWLGRYTGAFIAISHDRTFLTRLTRSTFWLDRGKLRRHEVGYGGFEAWTEQVYAEEARNAERLDAKLKLELHWLQNGVTARRRRNQGRLAKLHQMRAIRAAMLGPAGTAKLALENDEVKTKMVIEADGVTKWFPSSVRPELVEGLTSSFHPQEKESPSTGSGRTGEGVRTIIRDFSLRIQRGDRIGVVGANGTGKTTLLRLLTGEIAPDVGKVTRAKTLSGVMIDQQRRLLDPDKNVREILADGGDWIEVRGHKKHVQGYLKEFLFEPTLVDAKIGSLSGGERSRLLLAREFARRSNLLVLDEPTNDLDMETLDLLQEVIADYEGTVLIVSHDRDFLDRTVTITLGLDGSGRVDIVAGGYEDWQRKRVQDTQTRSSRAKSRGASPDSSRAPLDDARDERPPARKKLSYKDQRDYELLPARIEELDAAIARDEALLSDHDLYLRDPKTFEALTEAIGAAKAERDEAEHRWLELAEQAEALAG